MKLSDLMRDFAIIALFLIIVMIMFILQYASSSIQREFNQKITSDSLSGRVVEIGGPAQPSQPSPPQTPPTQPSPPPSGVVIIGNKTSEVPPVEPPPPQLTNENLKCWNLAGIRYDDIRIIKNVLSGIKCEIKRERKSIDIGIKDNCLIIDINRETVTNLCTKEEQPPEIKIEIHSGGEGAGEIVEKKNYYGWILFLLFILTTIFTWGKFEFKDIKDKRLKEEFKHILEDVGGEVQIKYIELPPRYKGSKEFPKKDVAEKIDDVHRRLIEERPIEEKELFMKLKIKPEDFAEYINKFNELARQTNDLILNNNIKLARRKYLEVFPVYSKLYNSLDDQKRKEIQDVIKYLHDQINIMEKSRKIRHLIEEAYREIKQNKTEPQNKAEDSKSYSTAGLKDLSQLRDLIESREHEAAVKLFNEMYGKIKAIKDTPDIKFETEKKDILDEIDLIHKKLEEKYESMEKEEVKELEKELNELRDLIKESKHSEALEKFRKIFTTRK